ncbi:MAG: thioredoxin fold domain-containing protein [Prevotellaceae bacterium]|nr:thioredoxin fold domain-containing protein [Prevotellaceae bacterium]
MRKILVLTCFLSTLTVLDAQDFNLGQDKNRETVSWTFASEKTGDSEFELSFKAKISAGFYMYGLEKTEGPLPLEFTFEPSGDYELIGEMIPDKKSKEKFDEAFEVNVKYYEGTVTFKQKAKISAAKVNIKGIVSYQACSSEQCIPGDSEFSFNLEGAVSESKTKPDSKLDSKPETRPAVKSAVAGKDSSLPGFFILAFFMGLLGVLTPCVFPMIPMTVSFFMSGSGKRAVVATKGLIFGLSITLIYTLIGLIVALTQNEAFATVLSSHWIPNLLFFILFVAFALSFFGLFEITLPSGLANRADRQADKGGYLASFFLAVTLAVVSFSCTGPFVGTLLVQSARGGIALEPVLGMFGFGTGLSLPFIVFAFLPSLMKKLPKSGGWLNSVKVVFAFVIAGMSLKFLDIVDNYFTLNIITRDAVIAVWTVLAIFIGLYLLGKIKLPHDSDLKHVGIFRMLLAIASFSFAFYLLPGLFGAPLSAVSAFMPAQEKQVFSLISGNSAPVPSVAAMNTDNLCGTPRYSDFLTLPKGISGYFDLKEGLACAKEKNRPVFLDFKGHNCGNCKKMEKGIFLDKRIIDILNEKFTVIGLYTDDKTELPESEHITASNGRILKTVGAVNLNYEAETYGLNAQPYFVITDADGKALTDGLGYETDADKFLQWLQTGLELFNKERKNE